MFGALRFFYRFVAQKTLQARAPSLRFFCSLTGNVAADKILGFFNKLALLFPLL